MVLKRFLSGIKRKQTNEDKMVELLDFEGVFLGWGFFWLVGFFVLAWVCWGFLCLFVFCFVLCSDRKPPVCSTFIQGLPNIS